MTKDDDILTQFKAKAALAPITVVEVANIQEAFNYALDLCKKKAPLEALLENSAAIPSTNSKILAAPNFTPETFATLKEAGQKRGITVIEGGLRSHLAGIDLGIAMATLGIAESASCLVPSAKEDVRLATMICEISLLILKKSKLKQKLTDAAEELSTIFKNEAEYASFISGPSKTSDIERVLTIGVHGPLELHVALVED